MAFGWAELHVASSAARGSRPRYDLRVFFACYAVDYSSTDMDVLQQLFERHFHVPPDRIQPLQGELGGSGRKIIRLASGQHSAIGILYGVREENIAFLEFSRHFRKHGLPVPEIYGEDLAQNAYLEQDLGDTTLFDFLSANRNGSDIRPQAMEAYSRVVEVLPRFQVEAGR